MIPMTGPWRGIEVAGCWVTFRFAKRKDLRQGETPGLRYVANIDLGT
jgi:hypothetical protein